MSDLRSNEVGEHYVAVRINKTERRDIRVVCTWEAAEKTARATVVAEYAARGERVDGGIVEFLGQWAGAR